MPKEQSPTDNPAEIKRRKEQSSKNDPYQVDISMTKEELDMLDRYCQKAGVSRAQGLLDGIKYLIDSHGAEE